MTQRFNSLAGMEIAYPWMTGATRTETAQMAATKITADFLTISISKDTVRQDSIGQKELIFIYKLKFN